MVMTLDVEKIRNDFPILKKTYGDKPLVFLDNTATTQKPQSVIDCLSDFWTNNYSSVGRGVYRLSENTTQGFEQTRQKVAEFINANRPEEIVYTRGTTESLNLIAASWGKANLQEGDEIIISALEHHANIVPWQLIAQDKGAILKVIPCNDDAELIMEEYKKLLSPKTKIVSVTHIANSTGTINPIKEIIDLAHEVGAVVSIDGAQSIAHEAIDVQALDCDFFSFSGHKMYGPTGIGVLYGKYDLLAAMPPYQGGGEMIDTVTFEQSTYTTPPHRFEAGTPAVAEVLGLGKAIEYLQEIGLDAIAVYEHELLEYATEKLSQIEGLRIIGTAKEKASLISFTLKAAHPHDAAMIFDEEAICIRAGHHCAQPVMDRFGVPATNRASFSFYNTTEEIDVFVKAIERVNFLFS
ncbi:MAG: cysteine desulfurase [Fibrobacterales bacterium]